MAPPDTSRCTEIDAVEMAEQQRAVDGLSATPSPPRSVRARGGKYPQPDSILGIQMPEQTRIDEAESARWYALSVRHSRVFDTRDRLAPLVDTVYVPVTITLDARGHRVERPAVSRLLFVRTSGRHLLELERSALEVGRPFYIYRDAARQAPQPIPDAEMQMFILVSSASDTGLLYIDSPSPQYSVGQRVRVTEGIFKGAEGRVRRIRRDRRVVVQIEGICAVALPFIHASLLLPLD